jgi:hypothetical protein
MKNLLKIASIIGLTVITQTAYSGEVTATFTTGDILTAEKLKNIKSAVNDNDTRISNIALTPGPAGAASIVAGPTGPAGADSTVAGPAGPAGPAGANSIVAGPAGPAGADNTVAGQKGDTGDAGLGAVVFDRAPTSADDMNSDYSEGTVWVDKLTNKLYILEDNTANMAVWTLAAAPAVTYEIGDTGPGGGIVFYVTAGGSRGLEAAQNDLIGAVTWDIDGVQTVLLSFADGIGAGALNTALIVSANPADLTPTAAGAVDDWVYRHNGVDVDDWYLPSVGELRLMWANLADFNDDGEFLGANDSGSRGGFVRARYWSSNEEPRWMSPQGALGYLYPAGFLAHVVDFTTGELQYWPKGDSAVVRPIRAF